MIVLNVKDFGEIKIELNRVEAPNTCANFTHLVKEGFYDGLTFHRIIKGFMIQGGDPEGIGIGGPGYCIKGEFKDNGFSNSLSHRRGVISMARAMDNDSAGSQFFICDKDDLFLDGKYAAFGKVISGMEVVDKIASVKKNADDKPLKDVIILKATAEDEPDIEVEKI
ncbi:MAG: peptidylprolyl isomerase [Candidatus Enterosoma sp.]|nr:peptidylprolyl isomerase [Candidatus Enterosoma sp.]